MADDFAWVIPGSNRWARAYRGKQTVLAELAEAANDLARAFDALGPEQWSRTGIYPWPNVESRTVLWLGRHTVHEIEHHLMDLTR
jgi:S-DNA-T family DNA segregation ATPase FtsK/SpoIIIE